ncbi:MAG: hypothetical protein Q8M76_02705 [Spirochaetaceae bacterium]|nr:hypothetical protein [Spirochaetaceae bacterium]
MKLKARIIVIAACLVLAFAAGAQQAELKYAVAAPWGATVFGDIGGLDKIVADNFEIAEKGPGEVLLRSSNDRGKIASTSEGIAFYYREVPAAADFELTAVAAPSAFAKNNQASFGIMLRDKVFANEFVKENLGSYMAVGPINLANAVVQYYFQRTSEGLVKKMDVVKAAPVAAGSSYAVKLAKKGGVYTLCFGDEEPVVLDGFPSFAGELLYVGLFTSRNATVSFSQVKFEVK